MKTTNLVSAMFLSALGFVAAVSAADAPAKKPWVYQPVAATGDSRRRKREMGSHSHRCVRARETRGREARAFEGSGSRHVHPSRHARYLGPAAHARRSARVREGSFEGCLREAGRAPAGLAALRRALGPPLAGPFALCRQRWLQRRRPASQHLALPRLRHQGVQRRQALRPIRQGAARRR